MDRNDLLKAKLQQANIEISLEEAKKNERILNYALATALKLPENTAIEIEDSNFGKTMGSISSEISRSDLQAIAYQKAAAEDQIKVAKANYFPSAVSNS